MRVFVWPSALAFGLLLLDCLRLIFPEKNRLRIIDGLLFKGGYFQVSHDLKFYPDPTNQSVRFKINTLCKAISVCNVMP